MSPSPFLHFSPRSFEPGDLLVGLKSTRKSEQRVGQRQVDEVFEAIRKADFPEAPSIFTSLWMTTSFDEAIPRKAFAEDPGLPEGYLYEVAPIGETYRVEAHWEVEACRAVTQSGLRGAALREHVEALAGRFWRPEIVEPEQSYLLCPGGATVVRLARRIGRDGVERA